MQGADACARVGARADDEHARVCPRSQVSRSHVEADGDDGSSRPGQPGLGRDAAGGRRCSLGGAPQVAAEGPVLPGCARGAAHLPGDFALADDHGPQSRCRRKQINKAVATPQVTQVHVLARGVRGGGERALHRVLDCVGVGRGRGVDVDSDPIAGAQDHDSARVRHRAHEGGAQVGHAGESGDVIEGGVAVVRGEHMNSHNASI